MIRLDETILKKLLEFKADINFVHSRGNMLHVMFQYKKKNAKLFDNCISILVENGVNVNALDKVTIPQVHF
jgi:hypothetical protein